MPKSMLDWYLLFANNRDFYMQEQEPLENTLNEHINAVLQAYSGAPIALQRCLEHMLGLKEHHNLENLHYSELEVLPSLLSGDLSLVSSTLTESEVSEAKKWVRQRLIEIHASIVQQRYVAENLAPRNELTYSIHLALNGLRENRTHANDENCEPELETKFTV